MRNCVSSFLSRINTERKNVYPGYTKKNDNRTKCQQDCPRIELRYHRLAPVHHFHNSSFSSPLQRTTGMETTTPQIKNSIGRKVKNELDARAAHAFELFRAEPSKQRQDTAIAVLTRTWVHKNRFPIVCFYFNSVPCSPHVAHFSKIVEFKQDRIIVK